MTNLRATVERLERTLPATPACRRCARRSKAPGGFVVAFTTTDSDGQEQVVAVGPEDNGREDLTEASRSEDLRIVDGKVVCCACGKPPEGIVVMLELWAWWGV